MDLNALGNLFKAIGEPLRLRIVQLLCAEELSVGELVRVLDLPQSTVSRHLKTLRDEGLLADRPVGNATFYRATLEADHGNGDAPLRDSLVALMRDTPLPPADRAGLDRVLAVRGTDGESFFDRVAIHWDAMREACFGSTFHLEAFLHLLPAEWTVADLGTGTGYLLPVLARHFHRVIAVDNSQTMLDLAKGRLKELGIGGVKLRAGDLESLPLGDGEADLAIALLMLHHLPAPQVALAEIGRVLKPGGRLLLVEVHPHGNEQFRVRMADRRNGIAPRTLKSWLASAGFAAAEAWDIPTPAHPEHELAPLPPIYGFTALKPASAPLSRPARKSRKPIQRGEKQ
jgi:ubiquinone/menaquinone biosynthesis C-methylase UbiE